MSDEIISHMERVLCPKCGKVCLATVEHTQPWYSYVHDCEHCGYMITESEWENPTMAGADCGCSDGTCRSCVDDRAEVMRQTLARLLADRHADRPGCTCRFVGRKFRLCLCPQCAAKEPFPYPPEEERSRDLR